MSIRLQDMVTAIIPQGALTPNMQEFVNTYALPIAIAIPLAILIYVFGTRKGDGSKEPPPDSRLPPSHVPTLRDRVAASPPPAPMPMPAPGATIATTGATRAAAPMAPGAGSTPAGGAAPAAQPPVAAALAPDQPAPMVLVVEDSAVARAKLAKLFAGAGYRVETAVDGIDALEKLAAHHINVLVTDLEMPNMDGLQLIQAVLGNIETDNIPIVAVTGHDELQAHVRDYQGLYGIFRKPWNDRELLKRIETLARLRPPAGTRVSTA